MNFELECDNTDGFVLIDKSYLNELDSEMLYGMDILLDVSGKSELIYDFPDEEWNIVRARETKSVKAFCESGKMLLWLFNNEYIKCIKKECEIEYDTDITESSKWLHVPTGKLLAVTASELIQCLSYPELDMEIIFELAVPQGWYAFSNEGIAQIKYCAGKPNASVFDNIQEVHV